MFGWLVDKKNEILGYYHVTVRGDRVQTHTEMNHHISWFREDISPKMKMRYAERKREFFIEDAKFRGWKESLPKKLISEWIEETNKLSWEELIEREIRETYEEVKRIEAELKSSLALRGYELHKCNEDVGDTEYYITDINNIIVSVNGTQNMTLEDVKSWDKKAWKMKLG